MGQEKPFENDKHFKNFYYENRDKKTKEIPNYANSGKNIKIYNKNTINNCIQANININLNGNQFINRTTVNTKKTFEFDNFKNI